MQGHYLPEGVVWFKIARRYKTRFVNERLRIYYIDAPSLVHGQPPGKNAVGGCIEHAFILNEAIDYFRYAPREFLRSAIHYSRFSFHTRASLGAQMRKLRNPLARLLWAAMLPAGFMVYRRDRKILDKR